MSDDLLKPKPQLSQRARAFDKLHMSDTLRMALFTLDEAIGKDKTTFTRVHLNSLVDYLNEKCTLPTEGLREWCHLNQERTEQFTHAYRVIAKRWRREFPHLREAHERRKILGPDQWQDWSHYKKP